MRVIPLLLLLLSACTADDDVTPRSGDGGIDAAIDSGDVPCCDSGGRDTMLSTCPAGSLLVYPCCGGAPPPCYEVPDGGMCPEGTELEWCPIGGGMGCVPPPCEPDPPYCAPAGSTCQDECGGGYQDGDTCHCLCA